MRSFYIKQSINFILLVLVLLELHGNIREKQWDKGLMLVLLANACFTLICVEKKE